MDIIIETSLNNIENVLKQIGFKIKLRKNFIEAIKKASLGRIHIYLHGNKNNTFCEIHVDSIIHFLFLGVDYKKKPLKFFKTELAPELSERGIKYRIVGGLTWFKRKNKAILKGFKPPKTLNI